MKKYKYTIKVKKVITMTEELFTVVATDDKNAACLARVEAAKHPERFEEDSVQYFTEGYSVSCEPVEE